MDDWIIRLVNDTGYWGVGLLMFLETVFPPVPSEVIMTVAGSCAFMPNSLRCTPAARKRRRLRARRRPFDPIHLGGWWDGEPCRGRFHAVPW